MVFAFIKHFAFLGDLLKEDSLIVRRSASFCGLQTRKVEPKGILD